jgi:hypothetical protein
MRTSRTVLELLLIAALLQRATASADEPKREAAPEFKNLLAVSVKGRGKTPVILKDVRVRQLGERAFLVGTPCEYVVDKDKGQVSLQPDMEIVRWLPVGEVAEFYEFKDYDGYLRGQGK